MNKPSTTLDDELRIFILGDGGFARELEAYYKIYGSPVTLIPRDKIAWYQEQTSKSQTWTILGSGKIEIKKKMLEEARGKFASFIHPRSIVCVHTRKIGAGSIIAPAAVIAPNTKIGKHVLVNYSATIGHDSTVGDLSVISPNASIGGNCHLGNKVYVGAGAMIREDLKIADGVVIGMGAVVTKDILDPNITVVGIPARPLERHK